MSAPAVAKEPAGGVGPFHRRELRALLPAAREGLRAARVEGAAGGNGVEPWHGAIDLGQRLDIVANQRDRAHQADGVGMLCPPHHLAHRRSEEHTSELQSLMRISYAVFCLKKKTHLNNTIYTEQD